MVGKLTLVRGGWVSEWIVLGQGSGGPLSGVPLILPQARSAQPHLSASCIPRSRRSVMKVSRAEEVSVPSSRSRGPRWGWRRIQDG